MMKGQKFKVINTEYTSLKKGEIVTILNTYSMVFDRVCYKVVTNDGLEQYVSRTSLEHYDRIPCSDAIDNSQ